MSFSLLFRLLCLSNAPTFNLSRIHVTAIVGTGGAFALFWTVTIIANRGQFFFLGGILGSCVSIIIVVHFAALVFGDSTHMFTFKVPCHYLFQTFNLNYFFSNFKSCFISFLKSYRNNSFTNSISCFKFQIFFYFRHSFLIYVFY